MPDPGMGTPAQVELGYIVAYDEAGRSFDKLVLLLAPGLHRPRPIVDFGLYEWYVVGDLARWVTEHPGTDFCLDYQGLSHAGSPVWVRHADLVRLLDRARDWVAV